MSKVYIDMDGTIADLFGWNGWKDVLCCDVPCAEKVRGMFAALRPLVDAETLKRYIERYDRAVVFSMTPPCARAEICDAVVEGKMKWLRTRFPFLTDIVITPWRADKNCVVGAFVNTCAYDATPVWDDHIVDDNPGLLLSFTGSAEMPPWVRDFYWLEDL